MKTPTDLYRPMPIADCDGAEVWLFIPDVEGTPLPEALLLPTQTHTANVVVTDCREEFPDTDGLITLNPALMPGVRTADCVPITLYAPDIRAVAAVHAGWRGTVNCIAAVAVEKLKALGADPAGIRVWFGPSICRDCYEVSPELAADFANAGFGNAVIDCGAGRRPHLDLQEANIMALRRAGVCEANISRSRLCTCHGREPLLPSYRRERGTDARIITAIALKQKPVRDF